MLEKRMFLVLLLSISMPTCLLDMVSQAKVTNYGWFYYLLSKIRSIFFFVRKGLVQK
jgi:hypothetical protein